MSRTSELQAVPGVVAAMLFSRKGHLEEHEGGLTAAEAAQLANLCAALSMTVETQGRMLARLSDHPAWRACFGWMMWGPEMSFVAVHDSACIVRAGGGTAFNPLIEAMNASAGAEPFPAKGAPDAHAR